MNKKILLLIYLLTESVLSLTTAEDNSVSSTSYNEVCELDNSCISSSTLSENQTQKPNISEKWKYNISDGATTLNDTAVNVYHVNETNNVVKLEIDESNKNYSQSISKNETKAINSKFQIQFDERCICDVIRGSCDLNCCCDQDCLNINRDVFKSCNNTPKTVDSSACRSQILNSPLLCIVRDNLYSRHFYPKHQAPFKKLNVDKLLRSRRVFSWSFPILPAEISGNEDPELLKELKEYKLGSYVWIISNDSKLKQFRLPKSTLTSRDCKNTEPVRFLEDYQTVCTYRVRNVSKFACEDKSSIFNSLRYHENFSMIRNPNLTNLSAPLDCSNNCASVRLFLCENDDFNSCVPQNNSIKSSFNKNICERAVINVHYKIIHNGTEGIVSVELYLQITSIELEQNLLWSVPFRLTYEWVNQSRYYALSGYPGYVFGKPIISGYRVQKKRNPNDTENFIQMSYDHNQWLTYFQTGMNTECLRMRRNNILFRENIYAHCFIKVGGIKTVEQCEILQNEIINIMFGIHTNISNFYISSFGEPDLTDKTKWIPFNFDFPGGILNESCSGIIISAKIFILYALVGEHDEPQQTIVGIKVVGNTLDRGIQNREKLKISISVNFYDVTNPPLRIFAEPPTYEVKLPTDFFYPFFSTGRKQSMSIYLTFGLMMLLLVVDDAINS